MDQSELIKSIKDIAASAEPDKISKLIGIINNKYFKNIIRSCAIIELGKIKDKNALEFLIARLKKEDEDLKEEIISAIGAIGDKSAYFNLKIILDDEKQSIDLRIAAALALFELGYHEETEEILKKLRAQLREKRKITKDIFISDNSKIIEAIRNLLKSSAPDRSLKLQNIIKNRYFNNYIRSSALKALREFKDSSNKDFLIGLLNDPNENLKEEIISVLAAFGDKSVYSILNKILVNTNEKMELRIAAALGLYELGFEKETEPILKKLREQIKSKQIKKAGEEALTSKKKKKLARRNRASSRR